MELTLIKTEARPVIGGAESRRVRRAGRLPAIVYGLGREPHACSIDTHTFEIELNAGRRTFNLEIGGKPEAALLKDIQYDAIGEYIIHLDFRRIDLTKKIQVSVGLRFVGVAEPNAAGIVDHVSEDIMVECLPTAIPHHIDVSVDGLAVGHHVDAGAVKLPAGVTLVGDPHKVLVSYHYKHVVEEAAPVEAAPAEPIMLKEKKPTDEAPAKTDKK